MGREDDQSYITNGLWERCNKSKANSQHSRCFLFDWQNEVKDTVAAGDVISSAGHSASDRSCFMDVRLTSRL